MEVADYFVSFSCSGRMEYNFDDIDEEDSPYPEVRASVSNVDDPEMPALTFRMWIIGLVLCMIGSAMNVFFNFRWVVYLFWGWIWVLSFGEFLCVI